MEFDNLIFVKGNMFNNQHDALVNPINAVGAMGKGVALEMKIRYPELFKAYKEVYYKLNEGDIWLYKTNLDNPKIIYNVVTKFHWKDKSKLITIEIILDKLNYLISRDNINSIGIPAIGCGCGGLSWRSVKQLMQEYLKPTHTLIYCYEPIDTFDI